MLIDKKGKLFGIVSIIDILVVVVIIISILGISYKFLYSKTVSPFVKADKIVLKFYAEEVPDFAANNIQINSQVKDFEKGTNFGIVTHSKVDKSVSFVETDKGEIVKSSKPGYSSILVTTEGFGVFDENNGVTIDNSDYYIGKSIIIRTGKVVFYGRLYEINLK